MSIVPLSIPYQWKFMGYFGYKYRCSTSDDTGYEQYTDLHT